jgi:Rieske Fe-S protein
MELTSSSFDVNYRSNRGVRIARVREWQAVPAAGLHQGCSRRHGPLVFAWRGRCQHAGCPKAAATGGTPHCIAHGGGKRCQQEGCFKAVAKAPGSVY